jgi:hypothetical protein
MLGLVTGLKVKMYKGALHLVEIFDAELQRLANVVCLVQGHLLWQNYVHLHDETLR